LDVHQIVFLRVASCLAPNTTWLKNAVHHVDLKKSFELCVQLKNIVL